MKEDISNKAADNSFKFHLQRIRKSKEAITLLSNFGYLSILQITGYIFPLITMPYLAKVIGVEGFGKIAFASAVVVWFQTISDWGFNYTATRDVARNRNDINRIAEIFSNVFWARILLMVISFILLLCLVFLIPKLRENIEIILVTFLLIPGHILFPDWFFQALERMKYITFLNLISKFIFTVAVFVFIKERSDFVLQPLITSLGFMVSGLISMYFIIIRWRIKLQKPSIVSMNETIKGSFDVFLNNIIPNFYNSFSVMLLGFWGGTISNGLLDSGSRLVNISQQFMSLISRVFFPFLSRRMDKHNLYQRINLSAAILVTVTLYILAPLLIRNLFTEEFTDAVIVLRLMSISIVFLSLVNIYGTNYLILQNCEKSLRNITFYCSIIGFLLSFPSIYYFDFLGAAIVITITRGLLGISIMIKARMVMKDL